MTGTDGGQLSDWDSSDDDIERDSKSNLEPVKRANSLVNVRDRTFNLCNVYQGQVLEKSSFAFKSLNPSNKSADKNEQKQSPEKLPDFIAEDLPGKDYLEMPLNDDDCLAQSY